ncbi:hypothetical protein LTR75_007958 [Friedmanniomyces endolithicus]|nr:hypothetical protein LTR75_007958 [Friedmanniomyces endolithicus]
MASSDQATSTDAVSVLLNAAPKFRVRLRQPDVGSAGTYITANRGADIAATAYRHTLQYTSHFNPSVSTHTEYNPTNLLTILSTNHLLHPDTIHLPHSSSRPPNLHSTHPLRHPPPLHLLKHRQLKNASVAGIATGLAAAFVLFTLAAIYLYRRHQQGKPLPFFSSSSSSGGRFSRLARSRGSKNNRDSQRAFPESAWLYDPARTPPRTGSPPPQLPPLEHEMQEDRHFSSSTLGLGVGEGSASQMLLIPEPREGAVELGGSAPNSPPQGFSSPLLALPTATTRGGSGGRRGSGSGIGIGGGAAGAGAGAGLGISGTRAESPPSQDRRRRSGSPSSGSGSWGRRSTSQSPTPGRRSRGNSLGVGSRTDLTRPMSAIWEELPSRGGGGGGGGGGVGGGFVDDRTGLLAPISGGNLARHST